MSPNISDFFYGNLEFAGSNYIALVAFGNYGLYVMDTEEYIYAIYNFLPTCYPWRFSSSFLYHMVFILLGV